MSEIERLACPVGCERALTPGEITLVRSVFGEAIDTTPVRLRRRKWYPFHPKNVVMAPSGHIHFPPGHPGYCDDFSQAAPNLQGLLIHEMTHVWQAQQRGRFYLPLMRHPFCRYDYSLKPGWPLVRYGIEQQAEIVRHVFLLRNGVAIAGAPPLESYRGVLPFGPPF